MSDIARVSKEELAAETATALPDKEVLSLLDLNANLDLALDAAAPIDLAIGANANIAAPIDAAVSANVLSPLGVSEAGGVQAAEIHQGIVGDATATAPQSSSIDQTDPTAGTTSTEPATTGDSTGATVGTGDLTSGTGDATGGTGGLTSGTGDVTGGAGDLAGTTSDAVGNLSNGNLLDVNVNLNGDLHLASPIDGAVAANANAAAPIDASVSANIGSPGATSVAVANQEALIDQNITGDASATADQVSDLNQGPTGG